MSYALYSYPGNPRAFKALIAAQYAGVKIDTPAFQMGKDNKTKEFLSELNPLGKVPVLSTPEGSVFESNAIARYVARLNPAAHLYGRSNLEAGQVDQWIDFSSNEIDLPVSAWIYPILGAIPENANLTAKAKEDVAKALAILDKHLLYRTFLVGERVSLADIVVACSLFLPFHLVFDAAYRAPFGNVVRWYETLIHQPEFIASFGNASMAVKQRYAGDGLQYVPATAAAAAAPSASSSASSSSSSGAKKEDHKKEEHKKEKGKDEHKKEEAKEKKPKEEKKAEKPKEEKPAPAPAAAAHEPEDDEDDEPKELPKPKNPLDLLPPSSFNLDEFKRLYSNAKNTRDIFPEFWSKYDAEGWCWFLSEYKFNSELNKLYMVNNLVGGYLQRLDTLRKYGFGNLLIFGQEPNMQISGCWLFRGQDVPPMMYECDDAAWYTWKKLDTKSDADKELIEDYMAWNGRFGGQEKIEALDGKTYK